MIRFSYTIFYVKEVQKALDFYTAAFDLKVKFVHESGAYGELLTEGVTLAFASEELASMNVASGC